MKFMLITLSLAVAAIAESHLPAKRADHAELAHKFQSRNETDVLQKRQSQRGRMTWYDVTTAEGACGGWMNPGDFIIALNSPYYAAHGGYGALCGKSIQISYNGQVRTGTIRDECPPCAYNELDLSLGLFTQFASTDAGIFDADWWFTDGSSSPPPDTTTQNNDQPTTTEAPYTEPTSSSSTTAPSSTSTTDSSSSSDEPHTTAAQNLVDFPLAVVQLGRMIAQAAGRGEV